MKKLSERAMLVSLNMTAWSGLKINKDVTQKVAAEHGVSQGRAGKWSQYAIDPKTPSFAAVKTAMSAMRNRHYELTLPWGKRGERILTLKEVRVDDETHLLTDEGGRVTTMFAYYMDEMRRHQAEVEAAVALFISEFPRLKNVARTQLRTLFNAADYPADIAEKFSVTVEPGVIEEAGDFRAALDQGQVEAIREQIQARMDATMRLAMKDPYQRLYDCISNMAARLSNPEGRIRDTLVSNLVDLTQLLPGLNLTDDPQLDELRKQAERLVAGIDAQDLRADDANRQRVAKKARKLQRMMDTMGGFMGGADDQQVAA